MWLQIVFIIGLLRGASSFALYSEKFISEPGVFPSNHSSTIMEIKSSEHKSGKLMSCWYAGAREGASDAQIYCSYLNSLQDSWTAPQVVVKAKERAEWVLLRNNTVGNPILFQQDTGRVWIVYAVRPFGGWLMSHIDYKYSDDFGKTWSPSKRLVPYHGHLPRTKPMWIDKENLLLPLYTEYPKQGYAANVRINNNKLIVTQTDFIPGKNHLQPSFVKLNGNVFAYLRNQNKGHVLMSRWFSRSMEWGEVEEVNDLANPNSSIDTVARNKDEILIVYNGTSTDRSPLSLAYSNDGKRFKHIFNFEPYGENKEYSYPSLIKSSDGFYHLTYTYNYRSAIKHVVFDEEWLLRQKLISGK